MDERRALAVAEVEGVVHVSGVQGVRGGREGGRGGSALVLQPVVRRAGVGGAGEARE